MYIKAMRSAGIAVMLAAATLGSTQVSSASTPDALQQEINQVLSKTKGGVQISRNEIAWNGGEAIMSFPLPGQKKPPISSPAAQKLQAKVAGVPENSREVAAAAAASDSCPTETFGNDWYCFYQYKNFEGRRLQWNARHSVDTVYFSNYDFVDKTSSWSNKGGMTIWVMGRTRAGDDYSCGAHLWSEPAHSQSSSAYPDNAADCFRTS